jgi:hypothetical protein
MKTNTKKIIALVSILGILIVNVGNVFAEKIGTGSIVGSESTSDINWD